MAPRKSDSVPYKLTKDELKQIAQFQAELDEEKEKKKEEKQRKDKLRVLEKWVKGEPITRKEDRTTGIEHYLVDVRFGLASNLPKAMKLGLFESSEVISALIDEMNELVYEINSEIRKQVNVDRLVDVCWWDYTDDYEEEKVVN